MATYVVTTLRDELNGGNRGEGLSLREAIAVANARDGADRIVFDPALDGGTIQLTRGELKILDTLTIDADATPDDDARDSVIGINAGGRSRIFNIDADRVSLDSLSLIKGQAVGRLGGGAILHKDGALVVEDVTFSQNTATGAFASGGAIRSYAMAGPSEIGPSLSIINSEFIANEAFRKGGAIDIARGATTRLDGVTFRQNAVLDEDGLGGAIRNTGRMIVENTSFLGNRATAGSNNVAEGGAFFNADGARLILRDAAFVNNSAGSGGAIKNDGGTVYAVRTNFIGNATNDTNPVQGGGAISIDGGTFRVREVLFARNEADFGGAVSIDDGTFVGQSTTFRRNNADPTDGHGTGGAIHLSGSGTFVRLSQSTVSNNAANTGAGIAVFDRALFQAKNILIDGNSGYPASDTDDQGSGVYIREADVIISRATISNNNTGIYNSRGKLTVQNSEFSNNIANSGPAITSALGEVISRYNIYSDNKSTAEFFGGGGAVYADGIFLSIGDQLFNNTTNGDGGALYATKFAEVTVTQAEFVGNTSNGNGGSIFLGDETVIQRSRFAENDPDIIEDIGLGGSYPTESISIGGAGADRLVGSQVADDAMFGFGGADTVFGLGGDDVLVGGDGDDFIAGNAGSDSLYGFADNDKLRGGGANDLLFGDEGDDQIFGDGGADVLVGGVGRDTLLGGSGDDILAGESGTNLASGGVGSDIFVLDPNGTIRIKDFALNVDQIGLFGIAVDDLVRRGENIFAFGELVATVVGVNTQQIQADDFVIF